MKLSSWWDEFRGAVAVLERPSVPDRRQASDALDPRISTSDAGVAKLILAEVKDQAEKKRAALRVLETKATSIVGFSSAALAFAASYRSSALLSSGWLMLPAFILEIVAIICGLYALGLGRAVLPNAVYYNRPATINDPLNEARIAAALAERWASYERELDRTNVPRARRAEAALMSFVLGTTFIVLAAAGNMVFSGSAPTSTAGTGTGASTAPSAIRSLPSPRNT